MATYTPTKLNDADLLAYVQAKIDPGATAVNGATGEVTSPNVWTDTQKMDWCQAYCGQESSKIIVG